MLKRLFGSLPGLLIVVAAREGLIVVSLSPLSGPLRPLGLAEMLNLETYRRRATMTLAQACLCGRMGVARL